MSTLFRTLEDTMYPPRSFDLITFFLRGHKGTCPIISFDFLKNDLIFCLKKLREMSNMPFPCMLQTVRHSLQSLFLQNESLKRQIFLDYFSCKLPRV